MVISFKLSHPKNVFGPIEFNESLNLITLNASHNSNANESIEVTEFGIVIDSMPLLMNAPSPILVTELGILIVLSAVQFLKALSPIDVTELGMVNDGRLLHPQKQKYLYWDRSSLPFAGRLW